MKKLILLFSLILMANFSVNAQCTPDPQYTDPGVYPDSATGFPCAMVDYLYDLTVTNVIPVDTTTIIGGFPLTLTFDSAVVVSVAGLPPGFTYSCYDAQNTISPPDQCCFEGGTTGCISIVGTPQPGDEGTYDLTIVVDAYLEGGTSPAATQTVDYYSIEVLPFNATNPCVVGLNETAIESFKLFPNPVSESFTLEGLNNSEIESIEILTASGSLVNSYDNVFSSSFDINVADLNEGIYFVKIKHDDSSSVVRFVKE